MDEIELMGSVFLARRRRFAERLRVFAITLPQFNLIQLARRRGAISLSAAAVELSWDRPTTTLVARKCVASKWLSRKRSYSDRRSFKLSLTGHGEELLDRIESDRLLWPESLGDPLDILDSKERAELFRILDKVHRRAQDVLI